MARVRLTMVFDEGLKGANITQGSPPAMSDRSIAGRLASPMYSVEYEQIAVIEQTIEMLIAGRKLQLATLARTRENTSSTRLESARDAILEAGKHTLASAVKMGSAKMLSRCDIREYISFQIPC